MLGSSWGQTRANLSLADAVATVKSLELHPGGCERLHEEHVRRGDEGEACSCRPRMEEEHLQRGHGVA